MTESIHPFAGHHLTRIEPDDRLVVLARTLDTRDLGACAALEEQVADRTRLGTTCLGQALYRHRSVFRGAVEGEPWSHLELSYFRDVVPADAIRELVLAPQPSEIRLLRAEILVTTPTAFILPRSRQGSAVRPGHQTSVEYIDVQPPHLGAYRNIMRDHVGPAAARLVRTGRIGTFMAMETAAVLYRDPALTIDWNQIHLSDVDAAGFTGFGEPLSAALREIAPDDSGFAAVFAGLDRMRAVPRWTLNDAVIEADAAIGLQGRADR